jgi:hypothetical protein
MRDSDMFTDRLMREREIEGILLSEDTPLNKVQRIMHLGVEEETAEFLVDRHQIGQATPVYYEMLDEDDLY